MSPAVQAARAFADELAADVERIGGQIEQLRRREAMSEATPRPWEVIDATKHHGTYVLGADGQTVCDLYFVPREGAPRVLRHLNAPANAAFIVKACNSHDALVAALESLIDIVDERIDGGCLDVSDATANALVKDARAALAAAKGDAA